MNLETTCRILLAQARISFKLGAYVEAKGKFLYFRSSVWLVVDIRSLFI